MSALPAYMPMLLVHSQCLQSSGESIISLELELQMIVSYHVGSRNRTRGLYESSGHATVEPSLQPDLTFTSLC